MFVATRIPIGSSTSFPAGTPGLRQWALDRNKTYRENQRDGVWYLESLEPFDSYREPLPITVCSPNGTLHLNCPHLTGSETVVSSEGTSIPSIASGRINFTAGTAWDVELSDGSIYHLTEPRGRLSYNADGSGNHGTWSGDVNRVASEVPVVHHANADGHSSQGPNVINNGTFDADISGWTTNGTATWDAGRIRVLRDGSGLGSANGEFNATIGAKYRLTFDYERLNVTGQGSVGIATSAGVGTGNVIAWSIVPGSGNIQLEFTATQSQLYVRVYETSTTQAIFLDNITVQMIDAIIPAISQDTDAEGQSLEYIGQSPFPVRIDTPSLQNHNDACYLNAPHLSGSETVTSWEGSTSEPVITAGRIDWDDDESLCNLVLSDGTHYVCQEGDGTTIYDVSIGDNDASLEHGAESLNNVWITEPGTSLDWSILHGGTMVGGVFVPGIPDSELDAMGLPKELTEEKLGNENSLVVKDAFNAPELNGLGAPNTEFVRVLFDGKDRFISVVPGLAE